MVVVDASCAVRWFVPEEGWPVARSLLLQDMPLVAPDILPVEIANALLRKHRRGEAEGTLPARALSLLDALRVETVPHEPLLRDAVALSLRSRHALHGCLYLMVAQRRRLSLATFDRRLAALAAALAIPLWSPDAVQEAP
jgi:predicted nucleic acid-binding protein